MSMTRAALYTGAIIVGAPFALVDLALSMTVVFAPIGVPLIFLSGLPLAAVVSHYNKKDYIDGEAKKLVAEAEAVTTGPKPWFDDDDEEN